MPNQNLNALLASQKKSTVIVGCDVKTLQSVSTELWNEVFDGDCLVCTAKGLGWKPSWIDGISTELLGQLDADKRAVDAAGAASKKTVVLLTQEKYRCWQVL